MTRTKDDIQPIDDTPENVAKAIMRGRPKPKKEWRYLKRIRQRYGKRKTT